MKTAVMPKTIQNWLDKNKDKVESAHVEDDGFDGPSSPYSVWAYLKPGWVCGEAHQIHESKVKDFLDMARTIEVCQCAECKELMG